MNKALQARPLTYGNCENILCPKGISAIILVLRTGLGDACCVIDIIHIGNSGAECVVIEQTAPNKFDIKPVQPREIARLSHKASHDVPLRQQQLHQMTPDETITSGNQHFHELSTGERGNVIDFVSAFKYIKITSEKQCTPKHAGAQGIQITDMQMRYYS
jgi:hypothetical protein